MSNCRESIKKAQLPKYRIRSIGLYLFQNKIDALKPYQLQLPRLVVKCSSETLFETRAMLLKIHDDAPELYPFFIWSEGAYLLYFCSVQIAVWKMVQEVIVVGNTELLCQ